MRDHRSRPEPAESHSLSPKGAASAAAPASSRAIWNASTARIRDAPALQTGNCDVEQLVAARKRQPQARIRSTGALSRT